MNASATGAALGIARQTVASRLRAAEERLGRPLEGCAAQLETALRLDALGD
jgi:DNA-binding PucR family transcriptional regulator